MLLRTCLEQYLFALSLKDYEKITVFFGKTSLWGLYPNR